MPDQADSRLCAEVLRLLGERHGIGPRGNACPAWMQARLDHALDGLADRLGLGGDALGAHLSQEPSELEQLAELLRVGETAFYRDSAQWNALADSVLPAFRRAGRCRALSAGCGTGEEAWTLAMLLDSVSRRDKAGKGATDAGYGPGRDKAGKGATDPGYGPGRDKAGKGATDPGYRVDAGYLVVGQDRSELALAEARHGVYPAGSARHLPRALARQYLGRDGDSVRVSDELRRAVSFVRRDLMLGPPPGQYEIIVCKNLLIYFGDDAGRRVVSLLHDALAENGVLLVARSEVSRVRALGHSAREIASGVTLFQR
jgi:chemotaxis methyl-accepting protein methylase